MYTGKCGYGPDRHVSAAAAATNSALMAPGTTASSVSVTSRAYLKRAAPPIEAPAAGTGDGVGEGDGDDGGDGGGDGGGGGGCGSAAAARHRWETSASRHALHGLA